QCVGKVRAAQGACSCIRFCYSGVRVCGYADGDASAMKAHASPHRVIRTSGARKEERLRETLMEHFFIRVWDDLVGRTIGPVHFPVLLQPVMAGITGVSGRVR